MSKYPRRADNIRVFKDFEKYGRHFQTNHKLLRETHPDLFDDE